MNTKTNQTHCYNYNLSVGQRFQNGSATYTVKTRKVVPGLRTQSCVIETVEGPTVVLPLGLVALAN